MDFDFFTPQHLKSTILDILKDDRRDLAWKLIDHYYKKAHSIEHFDVLGYVSLKAEKRDTYLKCAEFAYSLAITPEQRFNARTNLYKAYNAMNRPEDALFYIEQNLMIQPDDFETLCQKAFNTSLMGQKEESEKMLFNALSKNPDKADKLQAAFSGKYLREGKTAKGILSFLESTKEENNLFEKKLKMKKWNGISVPGKTLYVDTVGGIGDQIINIRFFDRIKSLGMRPILVSSGGKYYKDINNLFIRHGYEVVTESFLIDRTQFWTGLMTLPGYLGLTENKLWNGPYLKPLNNPKNKIESNKFKIGIKCSGNPYFAQDEYRKIPLEKMLEYLPKDANIYYIDKEKVKNEQVIDLSSKIESWEDTLDLIEQMDCIVSSCTSLVHAAGAIGKTTFVSVPIAEYYIWTTTSKTTKSPWYGDNFQVHKQTKVRSWDEPLKNIQDELKKIM